MRPASSTTAILVVGCLLFATSSLADDGLCDSFLSPFTVTPSPDVTIQITNMQGDTVTRYVRNTKYLINVNVNLANFSKIAVYDDDAHLLIPQSQNLSSCVTSPSKFYTQIVKVSLGLKP